MIVLTLSGCGGSSNGGSEQTTYTLTVNLQGQGNVTQSVNSQLNLGPYVSGTQVVLTVNGSNSQIFGYWGNNLGLTNPLTIKMDGNKTITAYFGEPCGTCNGNRTAPCPQCGGIGLVNIPGPGGIPMVMACSNRSGTGSVVCQTCNGNDIK